MKSLILLGWLLFTGTILFLCRRRDSVDEEAGVGLVGCDCDKCDSQRDLGTPPATVESEKRD